MWACRRIRVILIGVWAELSFERGQKVPKTSLTPQTKMKLQYVSPVFFVNRGNLTKQNFTKKKKKIK